MSGPKLAVDHILQNLPLLTRCVSLSLRFGHAAQEPISNRISQRVLSFLHDMPLTEMQKGTAKTYVDGLAGYS